MQAPPLTKLTFALNPMQRHPTINSKLMSRVFSALWNCAIVLSPNPFSYGPIEFGLTCSLKGGGCNVGVPIFFLAASCNTANMAESLRHHSFRESKKPPLGNTRCGNLNEACCSLQAMTQSHACPCCWLLQPMSKIGKCTWCTKWALWLLPFSANTAKLPLAHPGAAKFGLCAGKCTKRERTCT